jgi:hypothetical protein
MYDSPLHPIDPSPQSNHNKTSFLKWRKRQQSSEPKEYQQTEEQPQAEEHEGGEHLDSPNGGGGGAYHQPNAQSWQPMNGLSFTKNESGAVEGEQPQTDNKAKAMELAKKGWAMYKDHKNKA